MKTLKGKNILKRNTIDEIAELLLNNQELMKVIKYYHIVTDSKIGIIALSGEIKFYVGLMDFETMDIETYLTDYLREYFTCEITDAIGVRGFEDYTNKCNECLCIINSFLADITDVYNQF